ncbi:hypothetical protein [Thalassobellus citreus]|uniref:hypothetical protein n=1 Tax=Thalassobellus citreus TaxID=3367752 RepID=UPI0037A75D10
MRITKSIGAFVFNSDQSFVDLANEKITCHIERSNGTNEEIATNISLAAFIATAVLGEGKIIDDDAGGSFSALCELGNYGAIPLQENESIVLQLTDLKSTKTYQVNGIEMPVQTLERLFMTEKVFLSGQKNRSFQVLDFDEAFIIGDFEKLRLTYPTDEGSQTVEYSKLEIRAISADLGLLRAGSFEQLQNTALSLVGVSDLEIFASNQVNIVLRDINKL